MSSVDTSVLVLYQLYKTKLDTDTLCERDVRGTLNTLSEWSKVPTDSHTVRYRGSTVTPGQEATETSHRKRMSSDPVRVRIGKKVYVEY